ncbi:hypothetical protein D9V86_05230 [Bacteroidetes/Chlorobi group bacterium ChocPot_Mid]|jgi:KDO2-lipid IV(A) lauroyltransferase|nr:MAG: hypothetical protein D9V86_05230 [Bacteroidetes/Chlorobi group bacterium ChocPot_Mid]
MSDKLITYLLLFIGYISSILSIRQRYFLGVFTGNILKILSKKRQKITYDNLKMAFPGKDKKWIKKVLKKSYQNLGVVLIETACLRYLSEKDIERYVKYENLDLIKETYNQGNGLILLSAHYGNWEFAAYAVGLFTKIPIKVIVKEQQNSLADNYINKYRTKGGNQIVYMDKAAREIVKTIINKGCVAIIVDQRATKDKDVYVDFFGRPASTYEAPATLALKYKVPVIYGFAVRNKDCTYTVTAKLLETNDIIEKVSSGEITDNDGIKLLTERHVKVLEDAIREHPDLWAWQHNRWKY